MSETLSSDAGGNERNEWENMSEDLGADSVEKSLDEGKSPEDIIKEAYDDEALTPDYLEQYGTMFLEHGLSEEKLEHYQRLARSANDSPENRRRRFDEEPEQEGYEDAI